MATRTLDTRRDRLITALIVPFMSCGARLPVYTLFISAFFAQRYNAPVMLSIYLLGILVAIVMANILGFLFFGRETSPLLMELPPYRLPTLRSVLILMWMRAWMYLKKAGTILLFASIIMWYLCSYPALSDSEAQQYRAAAEPGNTGTMGRTVQQLRFQHSYAGALGRFIEPVIKPLGFDWKVGVGLITGLAAKEAVVSTLGIVYGVGETDEKSKDLQHRLKKDPVFRDKPFNAYILMVFVLLYIPCLAVVAVFLREFGLKWALFLVVYTTTVAWIVAFMFRLAGLLFGLV
jgi:ferrous iron transport protein B